MNIPFLSPLCTSSVNSTKLSELRVLFLQTIKNMNNTHTLSNSCSVTDCNEPQRPYQTPTRVALTVGITLQPLGLALQTLRFAHTHIIRIMLR